MRSEVTMTKPNVAQVKYGQNDVTMPLINIVQIASLSHLSPEEGKTTYSVVQCETGGRPVRIRG